jgi:hypothetical protein
MSDTLDRCDNTALRFCSVRHDAQLKMPVA